MFGKNKKEQNDVDKYLSKKQRKAIAREEKDRIDRQKALEEVKYREIKGTQEMLPVYDTYQGVIVTRDGHFCKIMEVKPLNFMYLSPQAQNNIISLFSQMLCFRCRSLLRAGHTGAEPQMTAQMHPSAQLLLSLA